MTERESQEQFTSELAQGVPTDSNLGRYVAWLGQHLVPLQVKHDFVAQKFQGRHQGILKFVYITSAVVIGLVICQALFLPKLTGLIWGEVAALVLMLWLQRQDRKGRYHDRWMEGRYLAERLRCCMYTWVMRDGGMIHAQASAPSSFLADQERGEAWEEQLKGLDLPSKPTLNPETEGAEIKAFLAKHWLEPQRSYHLKSSHRNHRTMKNLERMGLIFLVITIVAAVMHAMGWGHYTLLWRPWEFFQHLEKTSVPFTYGNLLVVLAILLPAISAAANAIKGAMEYHKLSLRSRKIADGIERLQEQLDVTDDPEALRNVVDQAEDLFMAEHEEWFALVAHKEVEVG